MWVSTEAEAYRTRVVSDHELIPDGLQGELERVLAVAVTRWRVPRATVTVIEGDRQFFPARIGMEQAQTYRAASICALTVRSGEVVIAADTRADTRLWTHPAVTGPPFVRFYAGVPLRLDGDRTPIGALCVLDTRPKLDINVADIDLLFTLSDLVLEVLTARRADVMTRRAALAA